MPEYILENNKLLNRAAKKALLSMKVVPSQDHLYCLQLAKWILKNPAVKTDNPALLDKLDAMLYQWNPKEVMSFFPDDHDLLSGLNQEPLEVGVAVLNQLERGLR
ncbi:MAG: hypothetical protein AB1487_11780 [Thermodesulfobacteriota bacterium]